MRSLAEHDRAEILARKASWMRVKADGATGWVKMLSLRMDSGEAQKKSGDNGLRSLFNVAATGSSGSTVTTGVRGLSEENLENAQPNPQAMEVLQGYAESENEATRFGKAGKLNSSSLP